MSTSSVVLSVVLLTAAVAVAVPLARSAVSRWSAERAGRVYELPADYRPAALRATASAVVLVTGVVLAVTLPDGRSAPGAASMAKATRAPRPSRTAPRSEAAPGPGSWQPASTATPTATATATQTPMASAVAEPRTIGSPAGGVLEVLADGTRVWLPPQYAYRNAISRTFPLVVAYLPVIAADREELYPAFEGAVEQGEADPFVVVQPRDCSVDPAAAVAEAARRFRIVPGRRAIGVLGVGELAPCAVRAALAHPGGFGAVAGASGTYDRGAVGVPGAAVTPPPPLMLTTVSGESPQRASAFRLRAALRPLGVGVRIVDGVVRDDRLGGGRRRRELALVAQYLTEQLDGPGRTPQGSPLTRTHP